MTVRLLADRPVHSFPRHQFLLFPQRPPYLLSLSDQKLIAHMSVSFSTYLCF